MISLTLLVFLVSSTTAIIPLHYDLTITPEITTSSFTGDLTLTINVEETTQTITLNAQNLQVESVKITDAASEDVAATFTSDAETLTITSASNLLENGLYDVSVKYSGKINQEQEGLYLAKAEDKNVLLTNLHYNKARQVFPTFDDNTITTFGLKVIRPQTYVTVSNVPLTSSEPNGDQQLDTFAKTDPIAPYLFSFALLENFVELNLDDVAIYSKDSEGIGFLEQLSVQVVHVYQQLEPVKLNKIFQVVVPDGCLPQKVLQNDGLIIYRESAALFDQTRETSEEKQEIAKTIAHSIVKQSTIKSPSWKNLWVRESLTYSQSHNVLETLQPSWGLHQQLLTQILTKALDNDDVSLILTDNDTPDIFTDTHRVKAFAIVRMFSSLDQPGDILEDEDNSMAVAWTQTQAHPILKATRTSNNVIMFEQQGPRRWPIPVNVLFQGQPLEDNFALTMESTMVWKTFSDYQESSWYLTNANRLGFFRTLYAPQDWRTLAVNLEGVTVENRAILLEDAFFFVENGDLDVVEYLELVKYLPKEENPFPVMSFIKTAGKMRSLLSGTAAEEKFTSFSVGLVQHMYDKIGTELNPSETHVDKLARIKILTWLCSFGFTKCQEEMSEMLARNQTVEADLQELVYCGGMRSSGLESFGFLMEQHSNFGKGRFLKSMGCTSDKTILDYYITAIINPSSFLKSNQEKVEAFLAVLDGSPTGVDVALDFAKQYLEQLLASFSDDQIVQIFTSLSKKLVTEEQNQKVDAIIECLDVDQKTKYQALFASVKDTVHKNIAWQKKNSAAVLAWFGVAPTEPPTTKPPGGSDGAAGVKISLICVVVYLLVQSYV